MYIIFKTWIQQSSVYGKLLNATPAFRYQSTLIYQNYSPVLAVFQFESFVGRRPHFSDSMTSIYLQIVLCNVLQGMFEFLQALCSMYSCWQYFQWFISDKKWNLFIIIIWRQVPPTYLALLCFWSSHLDRSKVIVGQSTLYLLYKCFCTVGWLYPTKLSSVQIILLYCWEIFERKP